MNKTQLTQAIDDVREFMTTFKQPFPAGNPERHRWISDEFKELIEGYLRYTGHEKNRHVWDAWADIWYLVIGGALESDRASTIYEVDDYVETTLPEIAVNLWHDSEPYDNNLLNVIWRTVHQCNMAKLWTLAQVVDAPHGFTITPTAGDKFVVTLNGYVMKPPGWKDPNAVYDERVTELLPLYPSLYPNLL